MKSIEVRYDGFSRIRKEKTGPTSFNPRRDLMGDNIMTRLNSISSEHPYTGIYRPVDLSDIQSRIGEQQVSKK